MPQHPERHPDSPCAVLERRLDEGWLRIEDAIRRGEDVTSWEQFWIELLHSYEREFDAAQVIAGIEP